MIVKNNISIKHQHAYHLFPPKTLSVNENNLLHYSARSKSRYFISVCFKLQYYFFWNSFEDLGISKKGIW